MPFLKSKKKSLLIIIPVLLLLLTIAYFLLIADKRNFHNLTTDIFNQKLSGNTLNLHYTLSDPSAYHIKSYPASLPCYSKEAESVSREIVHQNYKKFRSINPDKLSEKDQYLYQLLKRQFLITLTEYSFPYYEEILSPARGMQSELPILLAEYTFRSKQDVDDYLQLIDQTDEYFSSLLVYEQEKKDAGLLAADSTLKKVSAQCYSILTKDALDKEEHFLQTTFRERLLNLQKQTKLSDKEISDYIALHNRLLSTVMLPAYENLGDGLFLLMGDGTSTPVGLSSITHGKEYYSLLVKQSTGSSLSLPEVKELLYPHFRSCYGMLYQQLNAREDSYGVWADTMSKDIYLSLSPIEILNDLQTRMQEDFPAFPNNENPTVSIKSVADNLADFTAPAFYLTPPLGDVENNVIYINEKSTPEGLSLYTTLAHEGYPGHLYQSVYGQLSMQEQDFEPLRMILSYGGYQEGWAVYVEFLSYDYAASLAETNGNSDAAFAYRTEKFNRDAMLCLYAILDVAIHFDGASYEQIHQTLSSLGIQDESSTRHIYDYIAEEPANYLKYYLGYLEILKLKEEAKAIWGESYSDLRFHTFLLDKGPSDFTVLHDALTLSD